MEFELINKLSEELKNNSIKFKKDFDLSKISHINASGISRLLIFPRSNLEVKHLMILLKRYKSNFVTIGGMSNCIFRDGYINTPLINTKLLGKIENNNGQLIVGAGVMLPNLERFLMRNNLSLYPGMTGIPATIGGAIFMNAGSYGDTISDNLLSVEVINNKGESHILKKDELEFNWRTSFFHKNKNLIITEAKFKVNEFTSLRRKRYKESSKHRRNYQESNLPNLGSLFASTDIYRDIFSKTRFGKTIYFLLRVFKKITKLLGLDSDLLHATTSRNVLLKYLKISNSKNYLSTITANCLINKDNFSANKLIIFIKRYRKKTKLKLEVIIYSKIK